MANSSPASGYKKCGGALKTERAIVKQKIDRHGVKILILAAAVLTGHSIFAYSANGETSSSAPNTVTTTGPATSSTSASEDDDEEQAQAATKVPQRSTVGRVAVRMLVPQKKGCTDYFIIYPYPVKPPSNDTKLKKLPKTMKTFRTALLASGYSGRVTASKDYPPQGWRWRYIFETAVAKSKISLPENVVDSYLWLDKITPYAIPELHKINVAERRRIERYNKMVEFWDSNGVDLENAATRIGRHSVEISFDKYWVARVHLPAGRWWVVGTHRIAGVVFYWQEPFTVVADKLMNVYLDEWNALVIKGDW